ncbi:S-layer homology domain-containing protein [Dysosmobacter sp.]|uniref:S-layer homology domain-containing protein n=1 Tax=Dysosmobacter sp. TaxID=2591382 RepID=UPI002A9D974B|nr:S-layer homology domain-containing protein [Dysosmobacter sp.]MDY5612110.1 S-layer homology domain-containing protein [Dysosmobacter sp.]
MKRFQLPKWLACGALATGLLLTTAGAFSDTEGHWAEGAINKWSQEYSIIQGYEDGTFKPDASITRGAFAGIMDRFLHFQVVSPVNTFSDIKGNYWEEAILKLNAAGVYLGNNGKALAGDTITRQQAVTMIARAFHIDAETTWLPYGDAEQISEYARPSVAEMTVRGYVNDAVDGNFRPTDPITRAEIVNILGNMIQTLVQTTKPYTEDVYGTLMVSSPDGATLSGMTIMGDLILAPGVQGEVVLEDVVLEGNIRNFSSVEPTWRKKLQEQKPEQDPEEEEKPGIKPEEVYVPGKTAGTFTYGGKEIPIYKGVEKSRLYEGDFAWNGDRLEYLGGDFDTRFGIDVSAYQNRASANNTIDWEAVADDGVEFVMVRIGLRGTSTGEIHADQYYRENIQGAMEAGIETGVYFFAQAITVEEAIEEADFVLSLLEDLEIDGPVAYDWEMHDSSYRVYGTSPEMATACAVAFCQRIEEAGYDAMVYAGQYVSYIKYDQGAIEPYLAWYPEYKSEKSESLCPSFYYQMDYWQFSSSCSIDGIGGRVDANLQFIPR